MENSKEVKVSKGNTKNIVRLYDIDILKGIGILFVILGHIQQNIPKWLLIYIYSFHMPLFYYISGYLYKKDYEKMSVKEYTIKRAKELLYPYLTLNFLNLVWYIIKEHSISGILKYILSFLYSNYIFDINYVGAIWFLMSLFIVEMVYFFIKKNCNLNKTCFWICVCFIFGICIQKLINVIGVRLPFWIDISFFGLFFYNLGYVIKEKCNVSLNLLGKFLLLFICVALSILGIILNYKYCNFGNFSGRIDMLYLHFGNYLWFILASISGIFTWHIISKILNRNKMLELYGKNTLVIMGVHIIFLQVITKIFKMLSLNLNEYFLGLVIFIVTAICSLLSSLVLKKYFPKFIRC